MSARDSETSAWAGHTVQRDEAERLERAEAARIAAEAARRHADELREVAHTTAMKMAAERDEALVRASELEEELAAARDQQPAPEPDPAESEPVQVAAEPAPAGPQSIRFAPRGHRPVLTILLALASLAAAATAVYEAYRDQLTSGPGVLAAAATVVLAISVGRTGRGATTVTIEKGVVHVTSAGTDERADLTSPTTLVELIGQPGERGRRVMLVRKTRGPLTVDDSMVDLDAFIETVRLWRPGL